MTATGIETGEWASLEAGIRDEMAADADWAPALPRLRGLALARDGDGAVRVDTGDPALQRRLAERALPDLERRLRARLGSGTELRFPEPGAEAFQPPQPAPWPAHRRLENFWPAGVAGRLGLRALAEAAPREAAAYNPVWISGPFGLGKTHLLQGFVAAARRQRPAARVLACTGAEFAALHRAHRDRQCLDLLHLAACQADHLVIDDLHLLAREPGGAEAQEALLGVFERRHAQGRQMVFSTLAGVPSDGGLSPRLAVRLRWGVAVELAPLDEAARRSLLRAQAAEAGLSLPEPALEYLSRCPFASVPEIQSLLRRLGTAVREPGGLAAALAAERARGLAGRAAPAAPAPVPAGPRPAPALPDIEAHFALQARLTPEQLRSPCRSRHVAFPRQLAMYCSHRFTRASMEAIGQYYGGRDHSTVKYACEKIAELLEQDEAAVRAVAAFREAFGV